MKKLFHLSGTLVLLTLIASHPVTGANTYYSYTIGKAGNRARMVQIQRNEALRRQQQQLQEQQKRKAQEEQADQTAKNNANSAPVPNPPAQNPFSAPRPYYAFRAIMPTNAPAKPKLTSESAESSRSLPVSEFNGPAYDEAAPSLNYQREQAQKGNPESQYAMGLRYLDGNGVMQSDALAREWLAKSSSNGNLRARAKLRELNSEK